MEEEYTAMIHRWSAEPWTWTPDIVSKRCLAIYTMDGWSLHPYTWKRLCKWLEPLQTSGVLYKVQPTEQEGQLHLTFHQLTEFQDCSHYETTLSEKDLATLFQPLEGIHIIFRGLLLTPTGLALCGYPTHTAELQRARDQLPSLYPSFSPLYKNTLCHATLFRWSIPPTEAQRQYVLEGLKTWKEAVFADMRPTRWELGSCSLKMTAGTYTVYARCWIPTRISHRGLLEGANTILENDPDQIQSLLASGNHVEFDVWKCGNSYFLGHDSPTTPIQIEPFLHPNAWIHAKNWDAFQDFANRRWKDGCDIRFFWHTTENWVFTSMGDIISYPGCEVSSDGCTMLPEKGGILEGAWICSDYHTKDSVQ